MYASNSLAIDEHTLAVIRFSRATCIFRMLCMPLTIMLPFTACADVKMISEMKTNDQMKKMEGTMTDASECASIAPAALMYEVSFVDGVGTLAPVPKNSVGGVGFVDGVGTLRQVFGPAVDLVPVSAHANRRPAASSGPPARRED